MEFPIKFDTVYIKGSQVILSKQFIFLSLKINFVLANSVDPDEMTHYAAFHLGLHCFQKYSFTRCLVLKGLICNSLVYY